jgi:hypothetical protein
MPEITTESEMAPAPRTDDELEADRRQLWLDDAADLLDFLDANRQFIPDRYSSPELSVDMFFTDPMTFADAVGALDANEIDHAGHWHIVRRSFGRHRIDLNIRTSDLEYPCLDCVSV